MPIRMLAISTFALAFIPIFGHLHSLEMPALEEIFLVFILEIIDPINPGILKSLSILF